MALSFMSMSSDTEQSLYAHRPYNIRNRDAHASIMCATIKLGVTRQWGLLRLIPVSCRGESKNNPLEGPGKSKLQQQCFSVLTINRNVRGLIRGGVNVLYATPLSC